MTRPISAHFAFVFFCAASTSAFAQSIPTASTFVTSPNTSMAELGRWFDHRAFEPATGLSAAVPDEEFRVGLSFGLETTLVAANLGSAFSPGGSSSFTLPSLPFFPGVSTPMVRAVINKGVGPRFDIGLSGLWIPPLLLGGFSIWTLSGDMKFVVWHQEEGPSFAIRTSYSYGYLGFSSTDTTSIPLTTLTTSFSLRTHVITSQFIASRRMSFADPYIALSGSFATGGGYMDFTASGAVNQTQSSTSLGNAWWGPILSVGVALTIPGVRFTMTPEMAFDVARLGQAYSFGLKTGAMF